MNIYLYTEQHFESEDFEKNSNLQKCRYTRKTLSHLVEKWIVREVIFCSFGPNWNPFDESSIFFRFQHLFRVQKFRRFSSFVFLFSSKIWIWGQKILFSGACKLSNNCQISMKSWRWERSDSQIDGEMIFLGSFTSA